MKAKPVLLLFAFALLLFLVVFHREESLPPVSASQDSGEITVAAYRDLTPGKNFFFPESAICFTWESLVGTGRDNWEPEPMLAESWDMSPDGRQWIFYLRKGIRFQDGEPFDAHAVLANFDRYQRAPGKTRFYRFRMDRYYPGFSGIEAVDDFTVALIFDTPVPTLPYYMATWGSAMFSPACFDRVTGRFTRKPAGTGPYRVTEHVPDQYAVLERFEGYWRKPARSKKIRIKVVPDVNTRYSAMKSEEIQGVLDLGGMSPPLARELLADDRFDISVSRNSIVHFMALNGERFPFDDLRMKRAVNMMVDRSLISRAFYHEYFPPATNILSYASPFYKAVPDPHDSVKAKHLARQVLGEREEMVDLVLSSASSDYPYKETAEYLQGILSELGLRVRIRRVEAGAFQQVIQTGAFHLYLRRQGLPHSEAIGIFNDYMRLSGKNGMAADTQNKRYHYNYYHPRAESLLDRAATTLDIRERRELYFSLQDLAAETIPLIPLVYEATLVVYNKKIHGYNAMIYGATLDTVDWRR